jgi:excisionase family DNA binding protein
MMTELDVEIFARAVVTEINKHPPVASRTWLSLKEAARYIGMSEQTLSSRVKNGSAPPSTLISRKARRFFRADIDAWIKAGGGHAADKRGPSLGLRASGGAK